MNGFAGPSVSAKKKSATQSPTIVAHATSGSVGAIAEAVRHERQVAAEHQDPQEDRAFERRPQAGDREQQRRRPRVVLGDVAQREVVGEERPLHGARREHRGDEHDEDVAAPEPQEATVLRCRPRPKRGDAEHRGTRTDREREDTEDGFRVHVELCAFDTSTFGGV